MLGMLIKDSGLNSYSINTITILLIAEVSKASVGVINIYYHLKTALSGISMKYDIQM